MSEDPWELVEELVYTDCHGKTFRRPLIEVYNICEGYLYRTSRWHCHGDSYVLTCTHVVFVPVS